MKKILIVGAASAMAEAAAREFASAGASLFLVGRRLPQLEAIAADLRVRGAPIAHTHVMDACQTEAHSSMLALAVSTLGGVDAVLIAHGTLPHQAECEADSSLALKAFEVNATSVISLASLIANYFAAEKAGCLAVISSVAGDRGRASNYVYGASKAAVSTFCSGLAVRMNQHGVRVICLKPGFVDTPMTAALPKGALWASSTTAGRQIHQAMLSKNGVVYVPGFWRLIMLVIRHIPEFVFLKLSKL